MSTDYGLGCKQCGEYVIVENTHRWGAENLLEHREEILTLYQTANLCDAEVTLWYINGGWSGVCQIGEFLEAHIGHELHIADEYEVYK